MDQRFDVQQLLLQGEPEQVAEGVAALRLADINPGVFSASNNGILAYREGSTGEVGELVWFDRQGRRLEVIGEPAEYNTLALSPDETRLMVARMNQQAATNDLWLFDLKRNVSSRFTFDPADELNPVWSPDGSEVAFCSTQKGVYDIYKKTSSGTADTELLLESNEKKFPYSWTPDGRFLLYGAAAKAWLLPLGADHKPREFLPDARSAVEVSPNGRWVVYEASDSGRFEVFVQSMTPTGGRWQISRDGGFEPHWRRDGKEVFYRADSKLMSAEVESDSQEFRSGTPHPLFDLRTTVSGGTRYQVAANGQRFLVNTPIEAPASPITVVTNWTAGLK